MKLEAIKNKLDKVEAGTTIGTFEIDIQDIRTDPTMQVRDKLDDGNKKRLRSAYKSGADVPPITVAFIDGEDPRPVVIDGHHRINVLETLVVEGQQQFNTVNIKAVKLSRSEARYRAAMANNTHGLQLKPKETRRLFAAYVLAGQHKEGQGGFKSYRQIGKELSRDHKTVAAWMRKDFPKEAAKMEQPEKTNAGGVGIPAPKTPVKHDIEAKLLEWRLMFEGSYSGDRATIISGMESLLETFWDLDQRVPYWVHDETLSEEHERQRQQRPPQPEIPF